MIGKLEPSPQDKAISTKVIEADLTSIERRMKKVRNPYSVFLFSIALIVLSFGLVGFLSIQMSDTARQLK